MGVIWSKVNAEGTCGFLSGVAGSVVGGVVENETVGSAVFEKENVGSGVKVASAVSISAMCGVTILVGGGVRVSDRTTEFCEQAEKENNTITKINF